MLALDLWPAIDHRTSVQKRRCPAPDLKLGYRAALNRLTHHQSN